MNGQNLVDVYSDSTNSLKTAEAIQSVLDRNDWSYTDHQTDIIIDHSENGLDLDPFFEIRHRNNVWGLLVKDILGGIIMNIENSPKPKLATVFNLVVQEMENRSKA